MQTSHLQGPKADVQNIPALPNGGLRLATCVFASGASIGVVLDDGKVVDLAAEASRQKRSLSFAADDMLALISGGDAALVEVKAVVEQALRDQVLLHGVNQLRLLSPIPQPWRNIFCVGWNYLDHFEEGKEMRADKGVDKIPENPVFFTKATNVMNGPFDAIPHDASNSNSTDWEAELAVVIGKRGRNISEAQAMEYVYGYSVFNDTSVREVQQKRHGGQWFKGKSLDGHGPMGPWIVPAGAIDLDQQRIICRVNGVEKQSASYRQMYFKIPRIIAELSRGLTLEPGDIISTGTPSGVGFGRKPPEFLQPGDVMESEVTGIGIIRNKIEAED
ncbi:MAG: fumarylacetoacetate hydrolase family protein [Burkholderiaceae bacterium]|nr:fumarylacetoacetate hydrolase family protein [Burkholderiaceae bacterium]